MEKQEFVTIYLQHLWFDNQNNRWAGFIGTFRPTSGKYYQAKIPVPAEFLAKDELPVSELIEIENE